MDAGRLSRFVLSGKPAIMQRDAYAKAKAYNNWGNRQRPCREGGESTECPQRLQVS